jgi:hypothetical protein
MMTPERQSELRDLFGGHYHSDSRTALRTANEMIDEIETLQAALQKIADAPTALDDGNDPRELRAWASKALGQYVERPIVG